MTCDMKLIPQDILPVVDTRLPMSIGDLCRANEAMRNLTEARERAAKTVDACEECSCGYDDKIVDFYACNFPMFPGLGI